MPRWWKREAEQTVDLEQEDTGYYGSVAEIIRETMLTETKKAIQTEMKKYERELKERVAKAAKEMFAEMSDDTFRNFFLQQLKTPSAK